MREKYWGVRDVVRDERPEEEMDVRYLIAYQRNRGFEEQVARDMWQELINDPRSEVSGDGADMTVMVQLKRRRIRGRERFEEG